MQRKLGNAWLITIITSTFEKVQCVVRENIHTPTTEFRGVEGGRGSEAQEIPEGKGLDDKNHFPRG